MLSEEARKSCINHLKESIHYCNENLLDYSGQELIVDYVVTDSLEFNASSTLLPENSYKLDIRSEVFEKTFRVLNTLLYEGNINFYTIASMGDLEYNAKKAILILELMHSISCRLIIYHELGHIFNGHLDYYQTYKTGEQKLSLFMDSRENQLPPIESQVLEMDADAFAATRLIGQFTYLPNIEKINLVVPNAIKSQIHAFFLVVVSSCITFSIMGLGYKREQIDYLKTNYLPLRTRQDYYVRSALKAYRVINEVNTYSEFLDIKLYREVLYNIEQYINLYYNEILGFEKTEFNSSNNRDEMGQGLIEHADFLESVWAKEMRSKLLPFSHLILAE